MCNHCGRIRGRASLSGASGCVVNVSAVDWEGPVQLAGGSGIGSTSTGTVTGIFKMQHYCTASAIGPGRVVSIGMD